MQTIPGYGARRAARNLLSTITVAHTKTSLPWVCSGCRLKTQQAAPLSRILWLPRAEAKRRISTSLRRPKDDRPSLNTTSTTIVTPLYQNSTQTTSTIPELPSTAARSRSDFSNRLANIADSILARASIAGQHINEYTGTDYSGIQTLREEITASESRVKVAHGEVESAKEAHHEEYARRAGAQKEIVGLLERKSSWSPTDLERYMSLVRSEHVNDQAVQNAKRTLDASERVLEDARQLLERLERKQYHEEQVWSDTIRRNSTWVTFGLMGVNILLLLGQILLFEPMRRKRIVKDLREALDEKTVHALPTWSSSPAVASSENELVLDVVEQPTNGVVDPTSASIVSSSEGFGQPFDTSLRVNQKANLDPVGPPYQTLDTPPMVEKQDPGSSAISLQWHMFQQRVLDLFDDRLIQVKQVELTNIALQGAAIGAAGSAVAMAVIFSLTR